MVVDITIYKNIYFDAFIKVFHIIFKKKNNKLFILYIYIYIYIYIYLGLYS
jgi:hypothetical protein